MVLSKTPVFRLFLFVSLLIFSFNAYYKYLGAGRDDVFFTLWAGKTLGQAWWFINYNGAVQEISSSILGALVAKLCYLLSGGNVQLYFLTNKAVGWVTSLITLLVIWRMRRTFFHFIPEVTAISVILLLGVNPIYSYWSLGGLEAPYSALIIIVYVFLAIRAFDQDRAENFPVLFLYGLAGVQILSILCRPEGFWLTGITAVLLIFYWDKIGDRRFKMIIMGVIVPLTVLCVLFIIRYLITGAVFPNPVYAKVSVKHLTGFKGGLNYLYVFYSAGIWSMLLSVVTIISFAAAIYAFSCFIFRKQPCGIDRRILVLSLSICAYEVFVVLVQGDWMEYHRFLVPTIALKIIFLGVLLEKLHSAYALQFPRLFYVSIACIFIVSIATSLQYQDPRDCSKRLSIDLLKKIMVNPCEEIINLNWPIRRDNHAILPFINRELSRYLNQLGHLTIATYQGGYFPYFMRERFSPAQITFLDTAGLSNLDIAKADTGNRRIGTIDIPAILKGDVPGLSQIVLRQKPNMVYELFYRQEYESTLTKLGFEKVFQIDATEIAGAVVYVRK